ncbi:MAG: hypothetical protein A2V70_04855 [Planctomycetes bacterium RBG_13_63_9]|nr:MAG: hypothetical protein A2V70_04855 [Planctomycetes bacterium RBG_13_63_9]
MTVDGVGSTWASSDDLFIGGGGNGTLSITGGGAVIAREATIQGPCLLAIEVGNGSMLTLDDGAGKIRNYGTVRLIAGAGAEAGSVHAPIAAGTWTGDGVYRALGGTWDEIDHVFTVSDVEQGAAGAEVVVDLAEKQRVMIDDAETGWSVGASFLAMPNSTLLGVGASPIGGEVLDGLEGLLQSNASVLGGWEFAATGGYASGDPAYLSFDIGPGSSREDLLVWHRDGADWSRYAARDLTYDGTYASFTVTELSAYAVTTVPEPSTMTLLLLGLGTMALAARRRWRRMVFCGVGRTTTLCS